MTNVTVTGSLIVDGNTRLRDTLITTNFSRFQAVAVQGSLLVHGNSTFTGLALDLPGFFINSSLNVSKLFSARSGQIRGGFQIDGVITVNQGIDLTGTLKVNSLKASTSTAVIQNSVFCSGTANLGEVSVFSLLDVATGLNCLNGTLIADSITSSTANVASMRSTSVTVGGSLTCNKSITLSSSLDVTDSVSASTDATVINDLNTNSYVSADDTVDCYDAICSTHFAVELPSTVAERPHIVSQSFYDFDGNPVAVTCQIVPGSADFAGILRFTGPSSTDSFGTKNSQAVSSVQIKFGQPYPTNCGYPVLSLQHVKNWIYAPENFWLIESIQISTSGTVEAFKLTVRLNLFQGFPNGDPIDIFWFAMGYNAFGFA